MQPLQQERHETVHASRTAPQAAPLLEGLAVKHMIADKGYYGDKVLQTIRDRGGQAVISLRSNRKVQRT